MLTPRLSSLWLGLVTPLYARVGRNLIESIRQPTVVRDDSAQREFKFEPIGHREAIEAALRNEDEEVVTTRWSDAMSAAGSLFREDAGPGDRHFVDSRVADVALPPGQAFAHFSPLVADRLVLRNQLWRLRGTIDLFLGGVGMRRGAETHYRFESAIRSIAGVSRRSSTDRRLVLRGEMKLWGRAWLEFAAEPTPTGSPIRQTAIYEPAGLPGRAYWYLVYPFHQLVFRGMLRGIVNASREHSPCETAVRSPGWRRQLAMIVFFLAISFSTAGVGAAVSAVFVRNWYRVLSKPAWPPPDWDFGPVSTALCLLMSLGAWLVWRRTGWWTGRVALGLFAAQLALYAAWSHLSFGLHSPGIALVDIILVGCHCRNCLVLRSYLRSGQYYVRPLPDVGLLRDSTELGDMEDELVMAYLAWNE